MSRDNKSGKLERISDNRWNDWSQQVYQKDSAFVHKAKSVLMLLQCVDAYLVEQSKIFTIDSL